VARSADTPKSHRSTQPCSVTRIVALMSRCMTADLYVGEHDEELAYDDYGVALLDDATMRRLHQRAHTPATRKVHDPHAPAVGTAPILCDITRPSRSWLRRETSR